MSTTFRQLVGEPLPADATPIAHIDRAAAYLAAAETQMAEKIDKHAGSASPPHALAFANVHLKLAEMKMIGRMRA